MFSLVVSIFSLLLMMLSLFLFSDSVVQSTSQLAKESCSVNDLDPLLRQEICKKLDIKHPTGGDYRTLAAEFYMANNDIDIISQNPDPTDKVL